MQRSYRFLVSVLFLGAYLLSACSGAVAPQRDDSSQSPAGSQFTEVVFTGAVETMGGGQWQISGQSVGVDGSTSVDANVKVGDIVRVEARVFQDGSVLALKVESSLSDDMANGNDSNSNGTAANSNDAAANSNDDSNANANANSNDDNSNSAPSGTAQEFNGVVEAITTDSITINGVTYSLAAFTEFKDIIAVGDQVKIHVIVNADGSLTIREIERITGTMLGNDNDDDNSNLNSNDDSSNANSNDDDSNDDSSNSNSNDDDSDDDNSNDDDDNGNDSNDND